jgi:hypothetical protein
MSEPHVNFQAHRLTCADIGATEDAYVRFWLMWFSRLNFYIQKMPTDRAAEFASMETAMRMNLTPASVDGIVDTYQRHLAALLDRPPVYELKIET